LTPFSELLGYDSNASISIRNRAAHELDDSSHFDKKQSIHGVCLADGGVRSNASKAAPVDLWSMLNSFCTKIGIVLQLFCVAVGQVDSGSDAVFGSLERRSGQQ
jgi:hypothetical protein